MVDTVTIFLLRQLGLQHLSTATEGDASTFEVPLDRGVICYWLKARDVLLKNISLRKSLIRLLDLTVAAIQLSCTARSGA